MLDSEVLPWRTMTFFGGQGDVAEFLRLSLAFDFEPFEAFPPATLSQFTEGFFLPLPDFLAAGAEGAVDFGVDCDFPVVPCAEFVVGGLAEFCAGGADCCSGGDCA